MTLQASAGFAARAALARPPFVSALEWMGSPLLPLDDLPLELIMMVALDYEQCASSRLAIWDEKDPHPAKTQYWEIQGMRNAAVKDRELDLLRQLKAADEKIRALEQVREAGLGSKPAPTEQ